MKECEIKILGIDVEKLIEKLESFGAKKTFDGMYKVHYFDYPDFRIREKGELLRIREIVGGQSEVVYKANKRIENEMKVYDEYEFEIGDFEAISQVFKNMGLKETLYYEKKRKLYELTGAKIEIDAYPKIPPYCEIETPDKGLFDELVVRLELQGLETSTETVSELFLRKYSDISLQNLRFS